jgi:hypothetical protein
MKNLMSWFSEYKIDLPITNRNARKEFKTGFNDIIIFRRRERLSEGPRSKL